MTPTRNKVPLEHQIAVNRKYAPWAISNLMKRLVDAADEIAELSTERLSSIGFEQYGDEMFWLPADTLRMDADEELADGVNRYVVLGARRNGDLPPKGA